jgi:hypothetical protein
MYETQEAKWFDKFIVTLISLNLVAFVLETDPTLAADSGHWFSAFDAISDGIFTVELAARPYACLIEKRFSDKFERLALPSLPPRIGRSIGNSALLSATNLQLLCL